MGRWRWHRQGYPGDNHQWAWPHDQPLDRAACRQFLDQHFLEQTSLTLKPGSMIRFVLLNPAEPFTPGWQAARIARRFVLTPEGTVNESVGDFRS